MGEGVLVSHLLKDLVGLQVIFIGLRVIVGSVIDVPDVVAEPGETDLIMVLLEPFFGGTSGVERFGITTRVEQRAPPFRIPRSR